MQHTNNDAHTLHTQYTVHVEYSLHCDYSMKLFLIFEMYMYTYESLKFFVYLNVKQVAQEVWQFCSLSILLEQNKHY